MAVTDVSEDDLDQRLREEAEDVFFGDGSPLPGQCWGVRSGVGLQLGCGPTGFSSWSYCT